MIHRSAFWLLLSYIALRLLAMIPGVAGETFRGLSIVALVLLIVFCVPLIWRFVFGRLLWKVRNRLIVTYVLMGLTPVVLFVTMALISLYIFSGQFAIFAATAEVNDELAHLSSDNHDYVLHLAHVFAAEPHLHAVTLPEAAQAVDENPGFEIAAFQDGQPVTLDPAAVNAHDMRAVPDWVSSGFRNVVLDNGRLYLRAVNSQTVNGHTTTVISSLPLAKENVSRIAQGLGQVAIIPGVDFDEEDQPEPRRNGKIRLEMNPVGKGENGVTVNGRELESAVRRTAIVGGTLPPREHFYDIPVTFYAPLMTEDWVTGKQHQTYTHVSSRPSLLYLRLFNTSLRVAVFVREALIAIAVVFGLLELLAFLAAMRLNRTITRSIHDLYHGTLSIDSGDFGYRIQVKRNDQLAALSQSFNSMAISLERLLEEQREKERMQNELAIAQEVQANLFPRGHIALPMLELHGICVPARTVSGDYYDFLLFGESGLGLALGDISGKGISAALLMATLHSAVRAYRFAGEELILDGTAAMAIPSQQQQGEEELECGEFFEEPAKILGLLNRHLYRSTQPEKYATLFLGHYDGLRRRLIYSTGGQLPPLLLRADDSVTRLDSGGTVVGLIDNVSYEQGTVQLATGDILVAYSDGVTEPENDFGEFGEERLMEVIRQHRHMPLETISEQVMQSLRSWIGDQEQPDDITLVLARQR
ncbi:PP2C family protein-serine/threonine phosphatase [Paracidobacterium acidisoli]|nr:SpoIIE family protein phosphatase [Paracidobacterium acidisoli]MBT9332783.1 SpoIIE family protein phosphatase [Paracidobacterium acidisoli]